MIYYLPSNTKKTLHKMGLIINVQLGPKAWDYTKHLGLFFNSYLGIYVIGPCNTQLRNIKN